MNQYVALGLLSFRLYIIMIPINSTYAVCQHLEHYNIKQTKIEGIIIKVDPTDESLPSFLNFMEK